MALVTSAQQVSSADSSDPASNYDVFLSFRGKDTRKTFTDHLYTALDNAKFRIFRDNDELERGKDIKPEFVKAIQQSRSSIIVFSKNYASSRWCLDELVMILKEKRASGQFVLPVFYDVDPSDVRDQTGSLAEAFAIHEKSQSVEKLNEWKAALSEAADLAGRVLQNEEDGYEARFIKKIVKVIEDKLKRAVAEAKAPANKRSRVSSRPSQIVADGQSGSDSCFKCGKPGHWVRDCDAPSGGGGSYGGSGGGDSSVPEKICPCGAGACMVFTAKTEQNRGTHALVDRKLEDVVSSPGPNALATTGVGSCSFPALECPCGCGLYSIIFTAKTGRNIGTSQFYRYSRNEGSLRTGSSCYKCGKEGHWYKDCPLCWKILIWNLE